MTVRIPRGMRPAIQKYEEQIQKLTSRVVAETLGLEREEQWSADVEPLGAGSWGVVYPLVDERFVLKVTSDPTEGPIISTIMAEPDLHDHMAIIHYFALRAIPEMHVFRNKPYKLYVVVAERLKNVGGLIKYGYGQRTADDVLADRLMKLKNTAGLLVHELRKKRPRAYVVNKLRDEYIEKFERIPDSPLSDFFIQFYERTDGGVLADVHLNNLGQRAVNWSEITDGDIPLGASDGYWVISDPGHSSIEGAGDIEELRENPRKNPRKKRLTDAEIVRKARDLYKKAREIAYPEGLEPDGSGAGELQELHYESSDLLDALSEDKSVAYGEVRAIKIDIENLYYEAVDERHKRWPDLFSL